MRKSPKWPVALTIAGSDSGGGAGIQADLKTFASLGVHGTSAITCLTAQNPLKVHSIQASQAHMVRDQMQAVFEALPPAAVKTGMLFSSTIIRTVIDTFKKGPKPLPPLVVDPVMVSTSGARLLQAAAIRMMQRELLPLAALVTPNLDEVEVLLDGKVDSVESMREAARAMVQRYGCAALIKGGHLKGSRDAIDIYYDGAIELLLQAPFVKGVSTHGTGCTYSAAIVGYLALGCDLPHAVQMAKEYVTQAIAQSCQVASHKVLNPSWK